MITINIIIIKMTITININIITMTITINIIPPNFRLNKVHFKSFRISSEFPPRLQITETQRLPRSHSLLTS